MVALLAPSLGHAQDTPEPVTVSGQVKGGETLLNAAWNEAADPKKHRYSFRAPSATVSGDAKRLAAYLPKELCIVALLPSKVDAAEVPVTMTVSGGRTTPVTVVVRQGQQVQIQNHDPFPHRLYDVGKVANGLGPEDIDPTKSRTWTPPGPGKYELRDEYSPSLRSWIVVEPKAAVTTYPKMDGSFTFAEIQPGSYTLKGYFMGEPVKEPALPIVVKPILKVQKLLKPLIVGKPKKDAKKK